MMQTPAHVPMVALLIKMEHVPLNARRAQQNLQIIIAQNVVMQRQKKRAQVVVIGSVKMLTTTVLKLQLEML
jgi:hypothetical protein